MIEAYIGPEINPYLDFHHLEDKSGQAPKRSAEYLYHPFELHRRLLSLLAQNMDRTSQVKAEKSLRKLIPGTESLKGLKPEEKSEIRDQRDRHKEQYFQELAQYLGEEALNQVLSSERALERRKDGLAGGFSKIDTSNINGDNFPYRTIRPEIRVLARIDPRLLNRDLIEEVFEAYAPVTSRRRGAFFSAGVTLYSPEYRLYLLAKLELTAKRHMIFPVLENIKFYGDDSVSIFFPGGKGRTPLDQKRIILERLILGDTDKHTFEARMGTEFFAGYLELIHQCRARVLSSLPEEERARISKIINAVTFMRTRQKKPGQSGKGLISQVLRFVATKEYDAAVNEIKRLMFENPRLWPGFARSLFELTPMEIEEFERAKMEREERRARARREKREIKREKLPQPPNDRDPGLRRRVEQLIGQTFIVTDLFSTRTIQVLEIAERRPKKGLPPLAGYVRIICHEKSSSDEKTKTTSLYTYGKTLRLAEQARSQKLDQS